ncbi:MAG: PilZ domain-containing protein [Thermodesulfobacteriota bacterium]
MFVSGDNGGGRRQYERFMREIPFQYAIITERDGYSKAEEWQNGLILDISAGGVRFLTMEMITKNSVLAIELDLRDLFKENCQNYLPDIGDYEGPVQIKGRVMWSTATAMENEYEVGVQFIENA